MRRGGPNPGTWIAVAAALLLVHVSPHAARLHAARAYPQRIVSLVPAVTEMLFAIGAGDAVIGVSTYDDFPPAVRSLPRVGALVDPDFERILSLRPDLVIVYDTQRDLIGRLDEVHVPVFGYEHGGLSDILTTIRRIGARVGRTDDANRTADRISGDLDAIRRQVAGRPRPRTALVIGRDPGVLRGIFVSAGVGFMHDMLEAAGGEDAFGDIRRQSVQASTEMLLAHAPDVILEVHPSSEGTADNLARARRVWNGLPALPAVQSGRVYILADDRLVIPGPRVDEAVRLMARVLHPGIQ
jgi:cobalamin transport system substrate-binding protein